MIAELFYVAFITIFIGLVIIGHALLFGAIFTVLRDDWAGGRRSVGEHRTDESALLHQGSARSAALHGQSQERPRRQNEVLHGSLPSGA